MKLDFYAELISPESIPSDRMLRDKEELLFIPQVLV